MFSFLIIIFLIPLFILVIRKDYAFQKYKILFYLVLFLLALIPKISFLINESFYLQGLYDIGGHLDYIHYFLTNFKIPEPHQCWECYQQPLYYLLVSVLYKFFELFGSISSTNLIPFLQFSAFGFYLIFLIVSVLIFNLILDSKQALIASSLILFWPAGSIHSARIGNDLLLYPIIGLFFYFFLLWWKEGKNSSLIISVFFLLCGLITKTNSLIMLPILIIGFILKTKNLKQFFKFCIILSIFVVPIMIFNQRYTLMGNKQDNWLIGNWNGMPKDFVGNRLENFISFDLYSFLTYPNIIPGKDEGGRQYFWIYLLKTSLFGELTITYPIQKTFSGVISMLILVLIIYFFIGIINLTSNQIKFFLPLILIILISIAANAINRIFFPAPGSSDFRYIYPMLIPFLSFVALAETFFNQNKISKYIYYISLSIFISLSFLFHTLPYVH